MGSALFMAGASAFIQCSSAEFGNDGNSGDDGVSSSGGRSSTIVDISGSGGSTGGAPSRLNLLCGVGDCVPDDAIECDAPGEGGQGGASGEGAASGGAWPSPSPSFGGAGSLPPEAGKLGPQGASCQIVFDAHCANGQCEPKRACAPVGSSERGEPCFASEDCAPGLACVGDGPTGSCQPYCCRGTTESCEDDEFCDVRPLAGDQGRSAPVCIPTDGCSLADPFPCPESRECACTGERACIVVRSDGQTACAVPGQGKAGDACSGAETGECAHGYVCSPSVGCLKLCSTVATEPECVDGGACQTPSGFPSDLGVCVSSGEAPVVAR